MARHELTEEPALPAGARRDRALLALLNEPTIQRAAESAGVGQRTLYRWLEDPDFLSAYRRARRETFSQAIAAVQRYAPAAVITLAKIMGDGSAPYPSRVSAASALLKFSRDSIELDDLAARIESLERAQLEGGGRGRARPGVLDMTLATDSELADMLVAPGAAGEQKEDGP